MNVELPFVIGEQLGRAAWAVRDKARVIGPTKVGCAVMSREGVVWTGCNVEHRFRSHDIHAEVCALSSLVAGGDTLAVALVVAATRVQFTPCGSCLVSCAGVTFSMW